MVNDNILIGFVYICTSSNYYVSPSIIHIQYIPMIYKSKQIDVHIFTRINRKMLYWIELRSVREWITII